MNCKIKSEKQNEKNKIKWRGKLREVTQEQISIFSR